MLTGVVSGALSVLFLQGKGTSLPQIYVGKEPVTFGKAQPLRAGGRLLIPLREVVERLGGTMIDGPLRRSSVVTVGRRRVKLSLTGGRSYVNGVPRSLRAAPWISKGEVVVPVRFFSDALGVATVDDPRRGILQIVPENGLRAQP